MPKSISIIGNGVYGRALAHLFGKQHTVRVFGRVIRQPGELLISEFSRYAHDTDYLIISITTAGLRDLYTQIAPYILGHTHVILAMKGLGSSGLLPIDECRLSTPEYHISILSGPGFAREIMEDTPVHLVLASERIDGVEQEDFLLDGLTLDFTHDIVGVSWCGILKNIYAIGAGLRSCGSDWDRAHYTTLAVSEMSILLGVLGGAGDTAMSPAGRGDIWICTTPDSRNFRYGASLDTALQGGAEGYTAALHLHQNYREVVYSGDFPIIESVITLIISAR